MGGNGSGTWYRWNKRTTCEEVKRIDIRYLRKQNMLRPNTSGSLSWNIGGEPIGNIGYTMYENTMVLNFRYQRYGEEEWESVQQTIWFDRTPCNYGGSRKWFLCPECNRRVGLLYGSNVLFLCRHCYQLPYASQGEGYLERMSRKIDKLSKKLGANAYAELWGSSKPKHMHMHWKTYHRLMMAAINAEDHMNNAILVKFGHWL
jgi:hypothetical protein